MNRGGPEAERISDQDRTTLSYSFRLFKLFFSGDGDFLESHAGARRFSEGDIYDLPEEGSYNFRFPSGWEYKELVKGLEQIQSITVACADWRQSAEVVKELELDVSEGNDAVIMVAGGAVQPDLQRKQSLGNFLIGLRRVNPHVKINLVGHTGTCAGYTYQTEGKNFQRHKEYPDQEQTAMIAEMEDLAEYLKYNEVDMSTVHVYLAQVIRDQYQGLEEIFEPEE